jgi:hypothetical protein
MVVAYNSSGAVALLLYLFEYIRAPTAFGAIFLPQTLADFTECN